MLALAWRILLQNGALSTENALLRNAIGTPLIMRDFEVNLLPYVTPLEAHVTPGPTGSQRVILVAKEGCPYCVKQLPMWEEFVTSSVLPKNTEIWLVSLTGGREFGELKRTMAAQARPHREFAVVNAAAFTLSTGIRGVPTTIVTRDNRVQLVYAGLFTDSVRSQLLSGDLLSPSVRAQFPSPGRVESILR